MIVTPISTYVILFLISSLLLLDDRCCMRAFGHGPSARLRTSRMSKVQLLSHLAGAPLAPQRRHVDTNTTARCALTSESPMPLPASHIFHTTQGRRTIHTGLLLDTDAPTPERKPP